MDSRSSNCVITRNEDFIKSNLAELAYFLALMRAVESHLCSDLRIENPGLDQVCWDRHFAKVTLTLTQLTGIDPRWNSMLEVRNFHKYYFSSKSRAKNLTSKNEVVRSIIKNLKWGNIQKFEKLVRRIAYLFDGADLFFFTFNNLPSIFPAQCFSAKFNYFFV
jgi:hypothetical protein